MVKIGSGSAVRYEGVFCEPHERNEYGYKVGKPLKIITSSSKKNKEYIDSDSGLDGFSVCLVIAGVALMTSILAMGIISDGIAETA